MDTLLLEALSFIDPAALSREEWVNVGMGLKQAGESWESWDAWSAGDPARYHPGECEKLWRSFRREGISAGTVIHMARERGWDGGGHELDWDSQISAEAAAPLPEVPESWIAAMEPRDFDPLSQVREYLTTLFKPEDFVGYVTEARNFDGRIVPTSGSYTRTRDKLLADLEKYGLSTMGDADTEAGAWVRFNPLDGQGISDANVTAFRYCLIEADKIPLEAQYQKIDELRLPVAIMVYSGGKSIHAIVKVDAVNKVEYARRVAEIYSYFTDADGKSLIDTQNKNPSRLSRFPGFLRGGRKQFIIPYAARTKSWQQWHDLMLEEQADALPPFGAVSDFVGAKTPPLKPELIHGVLRQGHKMLLAGSSKAGKSFALMELALAISTGGEWLGWTCSRGKVLYCNFELDEASARNRFNAICAYRGLDAAEACAGITDWNLRGYNLSAKDFALRLFSRAREAGFIAVIIDPIYKLGLGDENSAGDVGSFLGVLDTICTTLGCAVIYCHHHSKGAQSGKAVADRASGSGVFSRDADAILDLMQLRPTSSMPSWAVDAPKATAWRVSAVLREFEEPAPKNVWFRYPVHLPDAEDLLTDARTMDELFSSSEGSDAHGRAADERVDKAIAIYSRLAAETRDGWVSVNAITAELTEALKDSKKGQKSSVSARTVCGYFDRLGYDIDGDPDCRSKKPTFVKRAE